MALSLLARKLRAAAVAGVLMSASAAMAQTIYLPVQYQYGRYGELFYGGRNGGFLANAMLIMPDVRRNSSVVIDSTGGYVNGLPGPYTDALGPISQYSGFASPDYRNSDNSYYNSLYGHQPTPIYYSDMEPWTEVGHKGFTADDAQNEAYLNVPRYQAGSAVNAPEPIDEPQPVMMMISRKPEAITRQEKTKELQAWADAEEKSGKHPELVQELHKLIGQMSDAK